MCVCVVCFVLCVNCLLQLWQIKSNTRPEIPENVKFIPLKTLTSHPWGAYYWGLLFESEHFSVFNYGVDSVLGEYKGKASKSNFWQ